MYFVRLFHARRPNASLTSGSLRRFIRNDGDKLKKADKPKHVNRHIKMIQIRAVNQTDVELMTS